MIGNITLDLPFSIEFGIGKITSLATHVSSHSKTFFLVDRPVLPLIQPHIDAIHAAGCSVEVSTDIVPEPPIESLEKLLVPVRAFNPDAIVGIGGGSTMDLAKLVSVLFSGEQRTEDIIGIGKVASRKVRLITVSTTSGTGSEVTPIAVLTDTKAGLKKGVVSKHIIPDVAIVDPALTVGMPPDLTAVTGMDAITHCIEAYTNKNSHPVIDTLALEGIRLMYTHLERAVNDGNDLQAREAMALGSLYGGLCLGPVNTAAVHALAYPLGGFFKIPHGMSNSVLLPFVMRFNFPSCVSRYANIGRAMGLINEKEDAELAEAAINAIRELSNHCRIPPSLQALNIPETATLDMAHAAMQVQRLLGNNPREVTLEDAKNIYDAAHKGSLR